MSIPNELIYIGLGILFTLGVCCGFFIWWACEALEGRVGPEGRVDE